MTWWNFSFFSSISPADNVVYRLVIAARWSKYRRKTYFFIFSLPSLSLAHVEYRCWTFNNSSRLRWYGAYNMARKNYCIILCTTRNFIFCFACGELKLFFFLIHLIRKNLKPCSLCCVLSALHLLPSTAAAAVCAVSPKWEMFISNLMIHCWFLTWARSTGSPTE